MKKALKGTEVSNKRTGKICRTIPHYLLSFSGETFPILTTKKVKWQAAIAEIIGYMNGFTNAKDFDRLGTPTWYSNANKTKAWLDNPHRKGEDDLGFVYGAVAKDFGGINLIDKVVSNLSKGEDDRGEIITFWKPDVFYKGCLRPCMHSHQFTLLDGVLHLNSTMRSVDIPLGLPFNMIQCYWLLNFMAKVAGHKVGDITMNLNQPHIYEDQVEGAKEQVSRTKKSTANIKYTITPDITYHQGLVRNGKSTLDVLGELEGYEHHPFIKFPFSE